MKLVLDLLVQTILMLNLRPRKSLFCKVATKSNTSNFREPNLKMTLNSAVIVTNATAAHSRIDSYWYCVSPIAKLDFGIDHGCLPYMKIDSCSNHIRLSSSYTPCDW
jgi:hypothetical protein